MTVEWELLSVINLASGVLAVTDPMLFPGLQVELPPGAYDVLAGFSAVDGDRVIVCLRVVRGNRTVTRLEHLGEVIVDFAQVTVGDSIEMERAGESINSQEAADAFVAELNNIDSIGEVSWNAERSVRTPVVRTPGGDGEFAVYSLGREGVITGVEIVFLDDESPEAWG